MADALIVWCRRTHGGRSTWSDVDVLQAGSFWTLRCLIQDIPDQKWRNVRVPRSLDRAEVWALTSPHRRCCCPCRSPWRPSHQRSERESAPTPTWLGCNAHSSTLDGLFWELHNWGGNLHVLEFIESHPGIHKYSITPSLVPTLVFSPHSEKGKESGLVVCFCLNATLAVTSSSVSVRYWKRSMFGQFHPTHAHTKVFQSSYVCFHE